MANGQNKNNQRDNYFQSNIAKYGEDFIHQKPPRMLQFDAKKRLFKDMVFGNINYDEFGKYFTDPEYVDNLIAVATTMQQEHAITSMALGEFSAMHGDNTATILARRHANVAGIFGSIVQQLTNVKQSGYNIQSLMYIVTMTAPFKQDFSEFY